MNPQMAQTAEADILEEILLTPSKELIENRFSSSSENLAPCAGECSGRCGAA
jgi:hypothetical protein